MNSHLHGLMADAARFVRGGDLQAATRAIQAALAADAPRARSALDALGAMNALDTLHPRLSPTAEPARQPWAPGAGFSAGTHACSAGQRDYKLFVPPTGPGAGRGLVVMLHGCTQDPDDFAIGTGMNALAQQHGLCVLYPAQSAKVNPQRCWNWFKHSHQQAERGEPAIIASMTRRIVAEQGIDPARVYVAGLSAGGAMAAILGQVHPGLFAAVGVHSGLPAGAAHDLPSALRAMKSGPGAPGRAGAAGGPPTIIFHGDADTTVNPANADALMAALGGATDAAATVVEQQGRRRATCRVLLGADGRPQVAYWRVHGAGHAWSGGSAKGSWTDPQGPDASAQMLRFFSQHQLAVRPGCP